MTKDESGHTKDNENGNKQGQSQGDTGGGGVYIHPHIQRVTTHTTEPMFKGSTTDVNKHVF